MRPAGEQATKVRFAPKTTGNRFGTACRVGAILDFLHREKQRGLWPITKCGIGTTWERSRADIGRGFHFAARPLHTDAPRHGERRVFMARKVHDKDIAPTLAAAEQWIKTCILDDRSIFTPEPLWTPALVQEVHHAFVDHPDYGTNDFMTKLKGQMKPASQFAQRLMAEMLWALLLFPSNMKARTQRQQVRDLWAMSGQQLPADHALLRDDVLKGIGSGGPGFNNYRPAEMKFLLDLTLDLKRRENAERQGLFTNYDSFIAWIDTVPREGSRQFRHMLRFFAFPDRVERISSNNDRRSILIAFEVVSPKTGSAMERQTAR